MAFLTLTSGLTIKVPTRGTRNWDQIMLDDTFRAISSHDHTGSGNGTKIATNAINANAVDDTLIRLRNNQYLRGRNQAGGGDIDILKVNASDGIVFGSALQILTANIADEQITFAKMQKIARMSMLGRGEGGAVTDTIVEVEFDDDVFDSPFNIMGIKAEGITEAMLAADAASRSALLWTSYDIFISESYNTADSHPRPGSAVVKDMTIPKACVVTHISLDASVAISSGSVALGVTKNGSSEPTSEITWNSGTSDYGACPTPVALVAGDRIRGHTSGSAAQFGGVGTRAIMSFFGHFTE